MSGLERGNEQAARFLMALKSREEHRERSRYESGLLFLHSRLESRSWTGETLLLLVWSANYEVGKQGRRDDDLVGMSGLRNEV